MDSVNSSVLKNAIVAGSSGSKKPSVVYVDVGVDDFRKWCDFVERIAEGHQDRRCPWVFRGQSDASWQITSSFDRVLNPKGFYSAEYELDRIEQELLDIEDQSFSDFRSQIILLPDSDKYINNTMVSWFALVRHYGVPKRLIDFTRNPFVALYFAVDNGCDDYSICMANVFNTGNCKTRGEVGSSQSWMEIMQENRMVAEGIWNSSASAICMQKAADRSVVFLELETSEENKRIKAQEGLFMMPMLLSVPSCSFAEYLLNIPAFDRMKRFKLDYDDRMSQCYVNCSWRNCLCRSSEADEDLKRIRFSDFMEHWDLLSTMSCTIFRFNKETRRTAIREGLQERDVMPRRLFPAVKFACKIEQIAKTIALEIKAKESPIIAPFCYHNKLART